MTFYGENSMAGSAAHPGSRAFFSAHPVFRREEYARAVGRAVDDRTVSALLAKHLKAGNIRRVARSVFAAVPPHVEAEDWVVDRYLAAAKLKPDAILAYHSALELHGTAYTDAPEVQALTAGEPTLFETPDFTCRFLKRPTGFMASRDVTTVDRAGLSVPVTTLERTVADIFDRPDLAGDAEELWNSLALVERLKTDDLVRQARGLNNAAAAGALGWWLEGEQRRLGVPDKALEALRALKPKHPQYVLGAKKGDAKSVAAWNILVPRELALASFEGA
jgi:predicted transcriptional regulator of viral defense system